MKSHSFVKKIFMATAYTLILVIAVACGGGEQAQLVEIYEPEPAPAPPEVQEVAEQPEDDPIDLFEGMAINPFTGMWVYEELASRRPVAFVINNAPQALPHSGISQADIIYEVLAEGGITRLLAVFTDATADKIGPIRSTRDYFAILALNHDAVLAHHGGSPTGYTAISTLGIQNADGMSLEGRYFWRDAQRFSVPRMREHSSYTNLLSMHEFMYGRGFRLHQNTVFMFNFFDQQTALLGNPVTQVVMPFSGLQQSIFEFDAESGLFYRYQRNDPHVDEYTGTQVAVANIIIQQVPKNPIPGDSEGRINVNLLGTGTGYLVTNGAYIPIVWERGSANQPTFFADISGNPLTLNPGSTWIGLLQTSATPVFNNFANQISQVEYVQYPSQEG